MEGSPDITFVREQTSVSNLESTTPTGSSKPASHASGLASLSVELVEHILTFLPGNDIVLCRRVSRWFRDIVGGSVLLQYIIECLITGVVDNPARRETVQERLTSIREWRAATQHPQWTAGTLHLVPWRHRDAVRVFGSAYILREKDTIIIIQPPSKVKGRSEQRWVVDISGLEFEVRGLAYDHNEKVLALVENMDEDGLFRIHMLSVFGTPHPLAAKPVMTVHFAPSYGWSVNLDIKILGSKALFSARSGFPRVKHSVHVWDWHSGNTYPRVQDAVSNHLAVADEVTFLTPRHIIAGAIPMPWNESPLPAGALVCRFDEDIPTSGQPSPDHLSGGVVVVLGLPETARGMSYTDVLVSCHHPSSQGNNDIFHHPAGRAMVRIWADIQPSNQNYVRSVFSFSIFVSVDSILAATKEAATGNVAVLPWSEWGHHARIMDAGVPRHEIRQPGPSTSATYREESRTLYYYDFNTTHSIKSDRNSPHFTPQSSLVVEPSRIEQPRVLSQGQIETSLPYREHTLDFDTADNTVLGEDFLVTYRHHVVPGFTRVIAHTI